MKRFGSETGIAVRNETDEKAPGADLTALWNHERAGKIGASKGKYALQILFAYTHPGRLLCFKRTDIFSYEHRFHPRCTKQRRMWVAALPGTETDFTLREEGPAE